ncbi:MAG: Ryanodine receptor Ryr [Planctomycetes bacterium]|nr:Ryanodine receptor Ryr [Planctomycetota bacterium]
MTQPQYVPKPIDTARVVLPPALIALTERLAENAHELWASERIAQGWRYGPRRDDQRKEHPGLVPYAALSESEKDFDRRTAMGSIAAILALGYRIDPPKPGGISAPA